MIVFFKQHCATCEVDYGLASGLARTGTKRVCSAASVLRQALDIGLDILKGKIDVRKRQMKILENARQWVQNLPFIKLDLFNGNRQEREDEMEQQLWRLRETPISP